MSEQDLNYLRRAIALAAQARDRGNGAFGSLLVDAGGEILLEAENTVNTESDCTGHAETNLVREACRRFGVERLRDCTLYTSAEPCAMCAGAIFKCGIPRVVFSVSSDRLYELLGDDENKLDLSCREVFARGARAVEVHGPLLEEEGLTVFQNRG
jgi:tRNA(Arg) A34 adenosine deaminase TadA